MTVARTGNVEAAKVLLAHGADVNAKEQWRQQTPLMWAVAESHPEMAQELIAHGADVNARQVEWHWERQVTKEPREKWMPLGGLTPLLFAARQGCVDCARDPGEGRRGHQCRRSERLSAPCCSRSSTAITMSRRFCSTRARIRTSPMRPGARRSYAAVDMHTMPESNLPCAARARQQAHQHGSDPRRCSRTEPT